MYILNQDGDELIKFTGRIKARAFGEKFEIVHYPTGVECCDHLGVYSTEERVHEIMRMLLVRAGNGPCGYAMPADLEEE